jgi:enoyl-CoA hydratase/carnithine racemase
MEQEYFALLHQCTANPEVRVIVVTGAGTTFCPGLDSKALSEIATGIMAEHAIAWTLPRIIGTGRAMDLLLSARVFPAEEALDLGLVNKVVPREQVVEAALAYARDMAENRSPTAMATMKRQVRNAATQDLEVARLESMRLWLEVLKKHPDFAEGIASFVEKRPPAFAPWTG